MDHVLDGFTGAAGLRGVTLVSDGAGRMIRRVRQAEATDPDCTRWRRSKANDDATILHWQITD